jgi:hypothetical protein
LLPDQTGVEGREPDRTLSTVRKARENRKRKRMVGLHAFTTRIEKELLGGKI